MIGFFRKIRKKLADDNKPLKYIRYAVGEIVLVVIGILIALQINNWNEERKQNKIINTYLYNLEEDIYKDLKEYQRSEDIALFTFYSHQIILLWAGQSMLSLRKDDDPVKPYSEENYIWNKPLPTEIDGDFVKLVFLWSVRPGFPMIHKSSFDELKSTGYFSQIENQNLKDAINEYYSEIERRISTTPSSDHILAWTENLAENGMLAQDISQVEYPLDIFKSNPETVSRFKRLIRHSWYNASSVKKLSEQARNLVIQIDKELNKTSKPYD
jgi:hypothetical protein